MRTIFLWAKLAGKLPESLVSFECAVVENKKSEEEKMRKMQCQYEMLGDYGQNETNV